MARPPLSITIIALNEAESISQTIASVKWADEILVIDSGSVDGTREIAAKLGARVIERPWPGYGQQKNFAQGEARHDWVLNIDADEVVSPALADAIQAALREVGAGLLQTRGFRFPRKTYYLGRWIRHGGWYPNFLTRLADRRHSSWSEPHVHEELVVRGEVRTLDVPLDHFAFQTIQDQILTNLRFSRLGSRDLQASGQPGSIPKLLCKPLGKFIETYLLKRGFLDGLPGFIISINAAHSMFLKYAYLLEKRICPERIARNSNESPDRRQ